jgi:exodeoxyribonuclease VII large subunit
MDSPVLHFMITPDTSPFLSAPRQIWSVGDLTARMREIIEGHFEDVWVEGEVSGLKASGSGHCYFTLKDAAAQLRAVLFRAGGRFLKFILKEGQAVRVRGRLSIYAQRGEYQLVVEYVEPAGIGALQAAFEALKERLRAAGFFDPARKKPIPLFPRTVVLITSPTGAVLHDMLTVLQPLPLKIRLFPVPVQGEGAAAAISHALDQADQAGADLLIVARGGGSLEDLWAFNEEAVARAIARCRTPVISAVGHETDVTIADFVADLRAPTPSLAAEAVARSVRLVLSRFVLAQATLQTQVRWRMTSSRNRLQSAARRLISPRQRLAHQRDRATSLTLRMGLVLRQRLALGREQWRRGTEGLAHLHPSRRLRSARERLHQAQTQLRVQADAGAQQRRARLETRVARLEALSPLAVLGRGFSLARRWPDQTVVRSSDQVAAGDRLHLTLHRGAILCTVDPEPAPPMQSHHPVRRTGIFGGTFNPIHHGHLQIAEVVRERLHLDRILFIPCGIPPHKSERPRVEHRLAMLRLALAEHPHYELSDMECRRPETSYTIHTIEKLRQALPGNDLFFIIGADAFADFATWREAERLLTRCHFAIVTRPGARFTACPNLPLLHAVDRAALAELDSGARDAYQFVTAAETHLFFLGGIAIPVSASEIRRRIAEEAPVKHLLPGPVASYIMQNALYRRG